MEDDKDCWFYVMIGLLLSNKFTFEQKNKVAEAMRNADARRLPKERYDSLALSACQILTKYDRSNFYPGLYVFARELGQDDPYTAEMVRDREYYSPYKYNEYSSWLQNSGTYDDLPSDLKGFYTTMAEVALDVLQEDENQQNDDEKNNSSESE